MTQITLEQANTIIAKAFAHGAEQGMKPLTVAVVDAGGHLVALQRQDKSPTLRPKVATAKASGALALGVPSRRIGEMALERPHFVAALGPISQDGVVPVAGGVIVVDGDGTPLGAVGISGDTSDNDEACALAGIAAAGLTAQA
jgi:uncharacterized protein GlcG (DUF336 family)